MPTSVGPNTKGEENLVFGYDLGDVSNSYKGEPVTNYHDYDKSAMTLTGFNNWSCYDGNYTASYHTWGIAQSKTFVTVDGPDGKDTGAMLYYNFDGGFYGPTDWGGVPAAICTAGNKITVQGWVKAADAASVGKSVTPYLYFSLNAGGAEAGAATFYLTENWQLVSYTHTLSAAANNYNNILYFFTNAGGPVRMYLTEVAVLSGKDHAVQWLPGGTTRSATQGLLDLTGNSTIDLTNVSFDSNAQMEFDGTNDYIQTTAKIATTDFQYYDAFTVEVVAEISENTGNGYVISNRAALDTANVSYTGWGITQVAGELRAIVGGYPGSSYDWRTVTISTSDFTNYVYNKLAHIVWTNNGVQGGGKLYINGIDRTDSSYDDNTPPYVIQYTNDHKITIGASAADGTPVGNLVNGNVPVAKIYNRALTASEIKSNFNAIKGRFNI